MLKSDKSLTLTHFDGVVRPMPRCKLAKPNYRLSLRGRNWVVSWTDLASGRTKMLSTRTHERDKAELVVKSLADHKAEPKRRVFFTLDDEDLKRCWTLSGKIHDRAKGRASKLGLPFGITRQEVFEMFKATGGRCAVTGARLELSPPKREKGLRHPWVPSLDRIDRHHGYTAVNCRLVCCAANIAMNTWGIVVFYQLLQAFDESRREGFHSEMAMFAENPERWERLPAIGSIQPVPELKLLKRLKAQSAQLTKVIGILEKKHASGP